MDSLRNSSLIPVSKITRAPNVFVRSLWTVFFLLMLFVLSLCGYWTVQQYQLQPTTFQTEYYFLEHPSYTQMPSVTFCPSQTHMEELFRSAWMRLESPPGNLSDWEDLFSSGSRREPWMLPPVRDILLKNYTKSERGILLNQLPSGVMVWSTETSLSSIYRKFFNFSIFISFKIPLNGIQVQVVEQLPRTKSFLCFTVSIQKQSHHSQEVLSVLQSVHYRIIYSNSSSVIPFSAIIHEHHHFPFGTYGRHIHVDLSPAHSTHLFYSKKVVELLPESRNPCVLQGVDIRIFGGAFQMEKEVCLWSECLRNAREKYGCSASIDVLNESQLRYCSRQEIQDSCSNLELVSNCSMACTSFIYTSHNVISTPLQDTNALEMVLLSGGNAVEVLSEKELYSFSKLLSEFGGLCSLFIGFSCIFVFELLEAFMTCYFKKHTLSPVQRPGAKNVSQERNSHESLCRLDVADPANGVIQVESENPTIMNGRTSRVENARHEVGPCELSYSTVWDFIISLQATNESPMEAHSMLYTNSQDHKWLMDLLEQSSTTVSLKISKRADSLENSSEFVEKVSEI